MRKRVLTVMAAVLALSACGDPLEDVPRLRDADLAESAGQAGALSNDAALGDAALPSPETIEERAPRGGFLGFLRGRADAAREAEQGTQSAALAPRNPETRGRDARRAPAPGRPEYRQVGPGQVLPYGEIARLCGVSPARLGTEVMRYPERGRGYRLYDSAPGGTGLRSFYLDGFDDGCARQFSAALVLFGTPQTYEQIRYSPAGETLPVSATDLAYERVKSRVCRVPQGRPCGRRIDRLARSTTFVSIYERFGSNARWKNLLLHDGRVAALDIKTR